MWKYFDGLMQDCSNSIANAVELMHSIPNIIIPHVVAGRTFPGHPYFSRALGAGQLSLFNLLKAYSLIDTEVGYCQGLSFVAGILLMHVSTPSLTRRSATVKGSALWPGFCSCM